MFSLYWMTKITFLLVFLTELKHVGPLRYENSRYVLNKCDDAIQWWLSLGRPKVIIMVPIWKCVGLIAIWSNFPDVHFYTQIRLHWRHMSRRHYFSELECSLSLDTARMSHFCQQWRLKPSASKTICSVFHLHNTSDTRQFIWMASAFGMSTTQLYAVLQRTLDKDCRVQTSWRT